VLRLLLAACLVAGCASIGAPGGATTVVIPLESDGYLLSAASFHFTGPDELSVSSDDGEAALAVDLAPGVYQVELEAGWQLARVLDDGSWQPVDAVLAGPAAQTIPVVPGETAEVRFEFLVTGP
jgi:hypothetical protein